MQILKIKLIKGGETGVTLTFTKQEGDKTITDVVETHKAPVHIDFKSALKSMALHFAILADYIAPKQIKAIDKYDPKLIEGFIVTGYSIGGDEDDRGIVITGHKLKSNGKAIIINTPFTRFVESEESQYQFIDHLEQRITEVEREVNLYLDGKRAPEPQQTIDFPGDTNEDDDIPDEEEDYEVDTKVKVVKLPTEKATKKAAPKKSAKSKNK